MPVTLKGRPLSNTIATLPVSSTACTLNSTVPLKPLTPRKSQRKKWPSWERNPRDVRDPLYMPADAIASVAEAAGSKRVSAETALLVASNDLFWEVGVRPPKEVEQPFRTPRRIVK